MLTLTDVTKIYKGKKRTTNALNGITLTFGETGLCFILGKSGCGKSTLLNILAGIDTPTAGTVSIDGRNFSDFKAEDIEGYRNEIVGTIFQEYYLLPYYTVGENVKLALDLKGEEKTEEEKRAITEEYLKKVGLTDENGETLYDSPVTDLSGGQKQRVAIARALIKEPKIILADEPTGALDYKTGKEILNLLKEISKSKSIIVVTHDEEFAAAYGDRILRMHDGKITDDSLSEQNESETKETVRDFKPGKLDFLQCLKMAAATLTHKRFSLTVSAVCSVLALFFLGLCVLQFTLDENAAYLKQVYANDQPYVVLMGRDDFYSYYGKETMNQYDLAGTHKKDREDAGVFPIIPSGDISIYKTLPLDNHERNTLTSTQTGSSYYIAALSDYQGMVPADERFGLSPDERFQDKSLCRFPQSVNEVGISDIKADVYIRFGFTDYDGIRHTINSPDDLIGLKIGENATVCGVFSTPESELIRTYLDNPEREKKEHGSYLYSAIMRCQSKCLANMIYCSSELTEQDTSVAEAFIMPLEKNFSSVYSVIKDMRFKEDRHNYYVAVYSVYGNRVDTYAGFAEEFMPFLILFSVAFGVLAVLLTINSFNRSAAARKKEFGILMSIGTGKKSVKRLFMSECLLIAAIEFIVAYAALWLFSLILNGAVFRTTYFIVGWLPTLLILACNIFVMWLAATISAKKLNTLAPKDIINVAESGN